MIKMIFMQEGQLVAVVDGWAGPVPREGDYIYHPVYGKNGQPAVNGDIAGCVKQVVWGVYARPLGDEKHFVNASEPFVEVVL